MRRTRAASESDPLLGSDEARASSPPPTSYLDSASLSSPRRRRKPKPCCAPCYACFSAVCGGFLVWIGIYASLGWDYQQDGWTSARVGVVQRNAFGGAALWLLSLLISLGAWRKQTAKLLDDAMTLDRRDRSE